MPIIFKWFIPLCYESTLSIKYNQITQLIKHMKTTGFGLTLWPSSGFIAKV